MARDAVSGEFELERFLPYLLNQAAENASAAFQQVYRERHAMTRPEWRVLAHLGCFGAMTASAIGERARIHKTKVSRAVAALEQRRWLTRRRDDIDRRREILELTPAGRRAYASLGKSALETDKALRELMSAEEERVFTDVLQRFRALPRR
jgi:DNA-binding MarR family transcriptional regulator